MRLPGDLSEVRTATQVSHINKTRLKSLTTDVENPVICSRWARRAGTMQWGRSLSQKLKSAPSPQLHGNRAPRPGRSTVRSLAGSAVQ
eukprot:gene11521-biopygen9651